MTQGNFHFFFSPTALEYDHSMIGDPSFVVHLELDENFGESVQSLMDQGLVINEVVVQMNATAYKDPLLMTTLESDNLMVLDTLKDVKPSHEDLKIHLVIQKSELDGQFYMYFQLAGAATPLTSKKFLAFHFMKHLRKKSLFDYDSVKDLGGILRYDPAPGELQEFEIDVVRTSVSKPRTFKIKARTQEEAENIALDQAGNYEFSESESDYEIA